MYRQQKVYGSFCVLDVQFLFWQTVSATLFVQKVGALTSFSFSHFCAKKDCRIHQSGDGEHCYVNCSYLRVASWLE